MYGQLIELAIFGIIAFFVINKLLSTLGSTNEDEPKNTTSFFGENGVVKDVTATEKVKNIVKTNKKVQDNLKDFILKGHDKEVKSGLAEASAKIPNLNIKSFLSGAKTAFKMVMNAVNKNDEDQISELLDKRYINEFMQISPSYIGFNANNSVEAQISEIYTFGNNVFIKLLFIGSNIIKSGDKFQEEWTFSKNSLDPSPNWFLTNIDKSN